MIYEGVATILEDGSISDQLGASIAPWFSTYNQFIGIPGSVRGSVRIFPLEPFPAHEFCGLSPWEGHIILAHAGVEQYAKANGFERVEQYLLWLIRESPKRGAFCANCPNGVCGGAWRPSENG